MHSPRKKGLNTVFRRNLQFCGNIFLSSIFNELFLSEKAGQILRKGVKGVLLCGARDDEHGAGLEFFRPVAVCLPQQPFDAVSHNAFAVFFPHADRHFPLLIGQIDDGEVIGMRTFSVFEEPGKFLLFFDAKVLHFRSLRGDVLSALVSPSLEGVSAALRLHSLAEPVHLASLALLGLIRSLHSKLLLV